MACLDEEQIVAHLSGRLTAAEQRELLDHLGGCLDCTELVAEVAKSEVSAQVVSTDVPWVVRGSSLGRYVVDDCLGVGAMGIVYSAHDPKLNRKVALKLLRSDEPDPQRATHARERLVREAQALALVSHPNVITVHDVGELGEQVFITMELVDGVALAQWQVATRRAHREVLDVYLQAGRGLAAAHAAGLVHRDFKPDNVLVGHDGRVRVTDFGLARHLKASEPERSGVALDPADVSRTAGVVGTPRYMAPEQLSAGPTDARSDQFSFCVALYEAWFGQRPFIGVTVAQLREAIAAGSVQPPSKNTRVPRKLREALRRGLAADPAVRFPSMDSLLEALEVRPARRTWPMLMALAVLLIAGVVAARSLASQRLEACNAVPPELAATWSPQHRAAMKQSFFRAPLPYADQTWSTTEPAIDRLVHDWSALRADACIKSVRGEQSVEQTQRQHACLDQRLFALGSLVALFEAADLATIERAVDAVQSQQVALMRCAFAPTFVPSSDPDQGELRRELGQIEVLVSAEKADEARTRALRVVERAEAKGDRALQTQALFLLGLAEANGGDVKKARKALHRSALQAEASLDLEQETRSYLQLAYVASSIEQRAEEGLLFSEHAAATLERLGPNDVLQGRLEDSLALAAYYGESRFAEALAHERKAVALYEQALGPEHTLVATARSFVGSLLTELGQHEEAIREQQAAVAIRIRLLGAQHPQVASSLNNLANAFLHQGDFAQALETNRRCLEIRLKTKPPRHPLTVWSRVNVAHTLAFNGQLTRSLEEFAAAIPALERAQGLTHPRVGAALAMMSRVLLRANRPAEALTAAQRAVAIYTQSRGAESPATAELLVDLGEAHLASKSPRLALAPLEVAVRVYEARSDLREERALAWFALARALWDAGDDKARALTLARKAEASLADAVGLYAEPKQKVATWLGARK